MIRLLFVLMLNYQAQIFAFFLKSLREEGLLKITLILVILH